MNTNLVGLFEYGGNTLINPSVVTSCEIVRSEGRYIVRFNFVGGTKTGVLFNTREKAVAFMGSYKQHCRGEAV